MPTVEGNKVYYQNTPGLNPVYYAAQVVYSTENTSATNTKVTVTLRMRHGGSLYDSTNRAGRSGAPLGSSTYGSKSVSSASAGYINYTTSYSKNYSRGSSSKTIKQTFWVENFAENSRVIAGGARSTATATITIPAKAVSEPGKPSKPTVSSITQSSVKINMKLPASNGSSINETDMRVYTTASGSTSITDGKVTTGTSTTVKGLDADTPYWAACRAKNGEGWGPWSDRTKFTTKDLVVPDAPDHLTISDIDATSFNILVPPPATHGSAITAYQIQVATDDDFNHRFINKTQGDNDLDVTGRTPGERVYARARVNSAAGYSGWSPTAIIDLDTAAPGQPDPPILKYSTDTRAVFELPEAPTQGSPILDQQFQVSSSSGYGTTVHDSSSLGLERQVVGLALGITYYARQRGISLDGPGPWSQNLVFETGFFGSGGPWVGDGGEFKPTAMWIGDGGEWKAVVMSVGDGGEWKPVG